VRIVVTGALGHIGSRLIRDWAATYPGSEIVLIDDLSTQRYCSLFHLPSEAKYQFIEADVLKTDLVPIFSGANAVVHLAAITDAPSSFAKKDEVEQVNLKGTERVARACVEAGAALVFPSTTSVYGTQAEVVDEDCSISDLKPQSPYADSKLRAEQFLQELGKSAGLRFVICRFGTIFGVSEGMRFHTAINKFCWQAVMRQPITVWRTALHQNRPYLDLGDAIEAVKFIVEKDVFAGRVYNVLTTNATVDQIVGMISNRVSDVTVTFVDTEIMNQLSYTVSNQRFRDLGFEFHGDLQQAIDETVGLLKSARARSMSERSAIGIP
jgi:nucleoside-diphosphate-sugar epimerase